MSDIRKKRICADEAFAAYMALGPSRTLPRLREQYCHDTSVIPPASSTLKRWSTNDAWQARAREHDLAVQGETSRRAIEHEAEQRVEVSVVVEDAYRDMLECVRRLLPQTSGDGMIMELVTAAGLPWHFHVRLAQQFSTLCAPTRPRFATPSPNRCRIAWSSFPPCSNTKAATAIKCEM